MTDLLSDAVLRAASAFNEAEVRFHVIDPIVRALGYPSGDTTYLKLEEKLDYPYFYIGRKNKKKDLPVGFPDYRAGVLGGRGCFIIEAKAANVALSRAEIEQAHSYAAHIEVGADFFLLCNGLELQIYETFSGLLAPPIVRLPIDEINRRFHEIENVLAPDRLLLHCRRTYDLDLKLAQGLGSSVKIRDGYYDMQYWDINVFLNDADVTAQFKPHLAQVEQQMETLQREFELRVGDGLVKRDGDGRILASVTFVGATKNNDAAMKLIGLDRLEFSTNDEFLSLDPDKPTIFESTADFRVVKGTKLPPMFGQTVPIDLDVDMDLYVKTRMFSDGQCVSGDYLALANYNFLFPGLGRIRLGLDLAGAASLRLLV